MALRSPGDERISENKDVGVQFTVLNSGVDADRTVWLTAWEASPNRSPFAHPTHADLFSAPGDTPSAAYLNTDDGTQVLYVFIRRPIPSASPPTQTRFDTVTPYGYGGAYVWGPGDRGMVAQKIGRASCRERVF